MVKKTEEERIEKKIDEKMEEIFELMREIKYSGKTIAIERGEKEYHLTFKFKEQD